MWYMGISFSLKKKWRDSPGVPVAETLWGRGPGVLSLLVGELDPCATAKSLHAATKTRCSQKKIKKKRKLNSNTGYDMDEPW